MVAADERGYRRLQRAHIRIRIATALLWESSTASEQGAIGGEARFRRDFWRIGQLLFFGLGN